MLRLARVLFVMMLAGVPGVMLRDDAANALVPAAAPAADVPPPLEKHALVVAPETEKKAAPASASAPAVVTDEAPAPRQQDSVSKAAPPESTATSHAADAAPAADPAPADPASNRSDAAASQAVAQAAQGSASAPANTSADQSSSGVVSSTGPAGAATSSIAASSADASNSSSGADLGGTQAQVDKTVGQSKGRPDVSRVAAQGGSGNSSQASVDAAAVPGNSSDAVSQVVAASAPANTSADQSSANTQQQQQQQQQPPPPQQQQQKQQQQTGGGLNASADSQAMASLILPRPAEAVAPDSGLPFPLNILVSIVILGCVCGLACCCVTEVLLKKQRGVK